MDDKIYLVFMFGALVFCLEIERVLARLDDIKRELKRLNKKVEEL